MHKRKSLRQRLILTTVFIITITSTLFAAGALILKHRLEEDSFGRMVEERMRVLQTNPAAAIAANKQMHPAFTDWRFVQGENSASLPESILSLAPGSYHSVHLEDHEYQIQVAKIGEEKAFLLYDITEWESHEHQLLRTLAYGFVAMMILALFMAGRAANSILTPVRLLTTKLTSINPDQRNVRIASEFNDPDIGQIATAFDAYSARIDQFVERERSFTASASHELRTPLSVMIGAVDVIEANNPSPAITRASSRISRACKDMEAFIEATLFLSREHQTGINQATCDDLCETVNQVIEDHQEQASGAGIQIETDFQESPSLDTPESIVKITVANLLRNAIEHTPKGKVVLQIKQNQFVISDNGQGIAREDMPLIFERSFSTKPSGVGLGLNMVKRVCDRFGWKIEVDSSPKTGTKVSLIFSE